MSNKVLTILVIISLTFNLAFLVGFVYSRLAGPLLPPLSKGPEIRLPLIIKHLGIDRNKFKRIANENMITQSEFYRELSNETYNPKILNEKLEKSLKSQYDLDKEIGNSLINMRSEWSAEKAKKFFLHVCRRRAHKNHLMERKTGEKNEKD